MEHAQHGPDQAHQQTRPLQEAPSSPESGVQTHEAPEEQGRRGHPQHGHNDADNGPRRIGTVQIARRAVRNTA
jgi:hypothetical protein